MNTYDLAIIGAGPAGIMAAITASETQKVVLIEKNARLGRKILATGNGRCNITNRHTDVAHYHGGNTTFIKAVLGDFDQNETITFFTKLGVILKEEDRGRMFPMSNQAQTVVDALIDKLKENNVALQTSKNVSKIILQNGSFKIVLSTNEQIITKKLIITTGGKSASHLGSTGDAYYWAEGLGHSTTEKYPALVPIETVETWPKKISGLRVEGRSYITMNGKIISEKNGDILFTHFGLSAPAIMAHASHIAEHINHNLLIHIDLFPNQTVAGLETILMDLFTNTGKKTIKNALSGLVPSNLSPIILELLEIDLDKKTAEISKENRGRIAQNLKNLTLTIKNLRSFKEAQVTHGGISLDQIDMKTLQSKIVPGLYFAGEVLDVDGDSGGFNLQWAWSSGHLAGQLL